MNRKFIILLSCALFAPIWLFSQAVFNQNLYTENKYPLNPAYAGSLNFVDAYIDYKDLSSKIYGAPRFIGFGISAPIYKKMSLGVRINKQSEGLFDMLGCFADYSYSLNINSNQRLRLGISAAFMSNQLDNSKIVAEDPSAIIDVASKNFVGFAFQSAAGIVYSWNNFECSFSSPQLFESKNKLSPSFLTFMQYRLQLKNTPLTLKPSFLMRNKGNSPTLFDINFQTHWKEIFWVGIGYRNSPGIIASAGASINDLRISYAIELASDKYSNMFNQVHEICISYSFQKKKKIPNDSINTPYNNVVANNLHPDSLKKSTDSLDVTKVSTNKTDSIEKLIVTGNLKSDSIKQPGNEGVKDNYKNKIMIVDDGNGVFSIKSNSNQKNSISGPLDIPDQIIDSLMNSDEFLKGINLQNPAISNQEQLENSVYTIQLLINNSNNYLLKNTEIVDEARINKSPDGQFLYLYGIYNSKETAIKANEKFKKYTELRTEIILSIDNLQ